MNAATAERGPDEVWPPRGADDPAQEIHSTHSLPPEVYAALSEFAAQRQVSRARVLIGVCAVYLARVCREPASVVEIALEAVEPQALRIELDASFAALLPQVLPAWTCDAADPVSVTLRLAGALPPALCLQMDGTAQTLKLEFSSNSAVSSTTTAALADRVWTLLTAALAGPAIPLWQLSLLPASEQRAIENWHRTDATYPMDGGAHGLLTAQAQRTPTATAIVDGDNRLSYAELDARANRLARLLRARGVGPGSFVALLVERGCEAIVAIFAVLKAGAAYVPLDPAAPIERLRHIFAEIGAEVLLYTAFATERLPPALLPQQRLDLDEPSAYADYDGAPLRPDELAARFTPQQLAYVIYTSGSTGQPKGVLIEHGSVCNHCAAWLALLPQRPGRRVLQGSPLFFDAAVWEIFPTLASGGELYIPPAEAHLPGPELVDYLRRERIHAIGLTPSALAVLPVSPGAPELPDVDVVLAGGEVCSAALVARFAPGRQMWNAYGPTEATCDATAVACIADGQTPSIGRPLPNLRAYVLDPRRQPLPIGVPGELYVGGVGVARGYLNRPELTAEKFVADPFAAQSGARMYATGDLVCWRSDGQLQYLGRVDQQIKLRGHRIEPGEIDAALASHPQVREARTIALPPGDGGLRLVAYVVPQPGQTPTVMALRDHLSQRLPPPMIPAAFVWIAGLPLNGNGKLDVAALPAPSDRRAALGIEFVPPRNALERRLAEIFSTVLEGCEVGVRDNFFALGGDSIAALGCVSRATAQGLHFRVQDVFAHPTVEDLAPCVTIAEAAAATPGPSTPLDDSTGSAKLHRRDVQAFPLSGLSAEALSALASRLAAEGAAALVDLYPLTPMQQGMVFHTLLTPGSPVYYEQTQHTIVGNLDPECLARAWQTVVDQQPVLRTAFLFDVGPRPLQGVYARAVLPFVRHDLRGLDPTPLAQRIAAIAAQRRAEGFDLARPPLLRIDLMQTGAAAWTLLLGFHHALLDGWSEPRLLAEVVATYDALQRGEDRRPPPARSLADYIPWLEAQDQTAAAAFFQRMLAGYSAPTPLPGARSMPRTEAARALPPVQLLRVLPPSLDAALRRTAQDAQITLGTLLHSAFALLLLRFSGADDVVFGSTVSGRPPQLVDVAARLGPFINTLPLRMAYDEGAAFLVWARGIQSTLVALREFETTSLPQIQRVSEIPSGQSLFDCVFVFENYPRDPGALRSRCGWQVVDVQQHEMTNFALTVAVIPAASLTVKFAYDPERFESGAVERLLHGFECLLHSIATHPDQPLWQVSLFPEGGTLPPTVPWRGPPLPDVSSAAVQRLFEDQAARTPSAIAIAARDGEYTLSYAALNHCANQLARQLRSVGVGPERLVALLIVDPVLRLQALLAIWKAGGTAVPLEPDHPPERLRQILHDLRQAAGPATDVVLLHGDSRAPDPSWSGLRCLAIEALVLAAAQESAANLDVSLAPDAAAYVIYTSGSTGQPKGVVVTQDNAVHSTRARVAFYGRPVARCLQLASAMFDSSLAEILWTWTTGGTLILPRGEQKAPAALADLIAAQRVTQLLCVPSLYAQLLAGARAGTLATLQTVILGGETLPRALAERHRQCVPSAALYNEYGPTEATIWSTVYALPATLPDGDSLPIGIPIAGMQAYVLDRHQQPLPVGVAGELYLGGAGIARGYLNQPALTAQRFVSVALPDAGEAQPQRLYRTGDRVRWLPEGALQFLGRFDDQVKLRGYRIELGEIESALASHPGVAGCAVAVHVTPSEDPRLVAYVVPHSGADEAPAVSSLREHLSRCLPHYMLPAAFVPLAQLPRTASGKVDRRALPVPALAPTASVYIAPRTPAEQILSEIFAELLGVARVGVDDDFFALGGHSLLCIQVVSRAAAAGLTLAVADVYGHPTVAELATRLHSQALPSCVIPLCRGRRAGAIIFLPAVGGHLSAYILQLARGLRGASPVWGLTTPPHAGTGQMPRTLADLCAHYQRDLVAALAPLANTGPLSLVGYCFGGVAALELACQLQDAGLAVSQVLLLEAVAPQLEGAAPEGFDRVAALLRVAERWDLRVPSAVLRTQSEDVVIARIMAAAADTPLVQAYAERTLRAIVDTQEASRAMIATWPPRVPRAPIHLIRAAEASEPSVPWDYGWGALQPLASVCSVPGDHFSFIRSPHIQTTLAHLRRLIGVTEEPDDLSGSP